MAHPLNILTLALDRAAQRVGQPQVSGPLAVIPVFGPDRTGYAAPRTSLKLSAVKGYGNLELENRPGGGLAIVPLHMGYIQKGAQNHAMCRAAFLGEGQKVLYKDVCCVQASQGGYLEERDQWFFVLPVSLRERALALRGVENYSKLWDDITAFNTLFGNSRRGHLEVVIGKERAALTRFRSRFELEAGQTGALFFLKGQLVGVELAPSVAYFAELWPALVCFAYGAEAFRLEASTSIGAPEPLDGTSLAELRQALEADRARYREALLHQATTLQPQTMELTREELFLSHELITAEGRDYAGQVVVDEDDVVWASLFARRARVEGLVN